MWWYSSVREDACGEEDNWRERKEFDDSISIFSSAVDQQGVKVAGLMIVTAKENLEKAKTKLASVRDKQRTLSVKNKQLI